MQSKDKDGNNIPLKMSSMVLTTVVSENDAPSKEVSAGLNSLAISFAKLDLLKVISAEHQVYIGMNNNFDIDQFVITPFGIQILGYIDINIEEEQRLTFGGISIRLKNQNA